MFITLPVVISGRQLEVDH